MAKRPYERSEPRHRELTAAVTVAARAKRKPPTPLTPRERDQQIAAMTPLSLPGLIEQVYEELKLTAAAPPTAAEESMQRDIDRIITRLDAEIPEAQKAMDALLSRLRRTPIPVAA